MIRVQLDSGKVESPFENQDVQVFGAGKDRVLAAVSVFDEKPLSEKEYLEQNPGGNYVDYVSTFYANQTPADEVKELRVYTADLSSYQVLASNLLTSNNYSFSLNAIPMQAGEVVTDVYFDFGKVPVGFQSVAGPTLSVVVNGNAVNGYQMVNRADAGGQYQDTWQTAQASWVTIIQRLWNTPDLPKTGY